MKHSMNIGMPKFYTVKYGKNSISSYTGVKLWYILNNENKQAIKYNGVEKNYYVVE